MKTQTMRLACRLAATAALVLAATGARAETDDGTFEVEARFVEAGREALAAAGYFDTNRVDAADLQKRLLSRNDVNVKVLPRFVVREGEPNGVKCVTEYRYATDFSVQGFGNSATLDPCEFEMREVGMSAKAKVAPSGVEGLADLDFSAELVEEPTWMNYGVNPKGGFAKGHLSVCSVPPGGIAVELPFFPVVRFASDLRIRLGRVYAFGGLTNARDESADKFVVAFVKVDRVQSAGGAGEASAPAASGGGAKARNVELDVRYMIVDDKTLAEAGHAGTNIVETSVLQERLMAKGAARLVAAPRITVRSGAEAVADGVVEYIYPTEYEAAVACPTGESVPISFAKPCSFETREVGVVLKATPAIAKDGEKVSVSVVASLVTGPRWKNLASDDFEPAGKAACEAGPRQTMQVPLFSSRAHVEDSLILPAGETWAWSFGGGEKGEDADKFALVFVTPRLVEP